MNTQITKFTCWICRQLTADEFSSMVALMLEISSGSKSGYGFKEEPQTANDRKFAVDTVQTVWASEPQPQPILNRKQLKTNLERRSGRGLKPVLRRGVLPLPTHCRCEKSNAPAELSLFERRQKSQSGTLQNLRPLGNF